MLRKFADRERYNLLHFIRLRRKETAFSDPKYDSKRRGQSRKAAVLPTAAFKGLFQDNFSSPFLKTVDITRVSKKFCIDIRTNKKDLFCLPDKRGLFE